MKKTTYILIALIVAGILFAIAIPIALWLTFRPYNTQFNIKDNSTTEISQLQPFHNITIQRTDDFKLRLKTQVAIAADSTADTPSIKVSPKVLPYINATATNDTLRLGITITDEFISDNNLASYSDCIIPICITIPHDDKLCGLHTTVAGDYSLTGISTPMLDVSGTTELNIHTSAIEQMQINQSIHDMWLHNSMVGLLTANLDKHNSMRIKCLDSAVIDSIVMRPAFDGNIINLREARVHNVVLRPATDCGCIDVEYGPETIIGAPTPGTPQP